MQTDKPKPAVLLPCPFDGSEASMKYINGSYGYYSGKYKVVCTNCGVESPGYEDEKWDQRKGTYSIAEQAQKSAAEWWNRRTPTGPDTERGAD